MGETLERPNAQAVAADLGVGSADTGNDPDEMRKKALADAPRQALALNVPPVPPVRPRSDRNGIAAPTPNAAAPRTTDAAPADPNDPWQSSPMMVSLKGILIPGESGGDPTARNPISGARGTFQFMHDTFVPLMKKNHPEETRGKSDAEIWAMADNPNTNSREAAELAHDNMIQMQKAGVQITPQTLAGAHRLGAGGIIAVLKADPNTPMSAIVPAAFSQGGNMDIHDLTAAQFLAKPYPGGGGGGGSDPTGQNASWQRMQQNFQQAQEAMREITQDYRKDRDRVRDLASRYKPFEPTPAPRPPEVDPLQSFGGIASIFVALASGLSKTPAVAAMNGLAGVIDGAREKDWTKYAANYKTWKDNSEYAYKAHEEYSKDLEDAMSMMTKDVNLGEAMLKATLAIGGDYEKAIQEWRERPLDFQIKQDQAVKARQEMQKRQEDIDDDLQLRGLNGQRDAARDQLQAAQATNDPVKVAEAQDHLTKAEAAVEQKLSDIEKRKAAQLGGRSRSGGAGNLTAQQELQLLKDWDKEHPGAPEAEREAAWLRIRAKEDPTRRTDIRQQEADTRADRAKADAEYKQKMAATGADRVAVAREAIEKRVELGMAQLSERATNDERKAHATERHAKIEEEIKRDTLRKRWDDIRKELGMATLYQKDRTTDKKIEATEKIAARNDERQSLHNKRADDIRADTRLDDKERKARLDTETERHHREGETRAMTNAEIHEDFNNRKLALDEDKSLSARELSLRRQEDVERRTRLLEANAAQRLVRAPTAAAAKERDAEILAESTFADQHKRAPTDSKEDQATMAKLRVDARRSAVNEVISDINADFTAERVLAGDERATVGMARSSANITKVTNHLVIKAKEMGISARELAVRIAEFSGLMASERTLGVRFANMEVAAKEVEQFAPLALQRSKDVDRTEYPDLNSIILAYEQKTGSPEVVLFGQAVNSMVYVYAKFLNPIGVLTDGDKAIAREILSKSWSEGQFEAQVKQIGMEIQFGQKAVAGVKQELRDAHGVTQDQPPGGQQTLPAEAISKLTEGQSTTFGNGQVWTLKNGQPVRVK
jgi:hypothetical protein